MPNGAQASVRLDVYPNHEEAQVGAEYKTGENCRLDLKRSIEAQAASILLDRGDPDAVKPDGETLRHHQSAFCNVTRTSSSFNTRRRRRSCSVSCPCSSADR